MPLDFKYPALPSNIPYNEDYLYRALGQSGYNDFLEKNYLGPKSGGKYKDTYFSKGYPETRYAGPSGRKYIAELASRNIDGPGGTYYSTTDFPKGLKDRFRIYEELGLGKYKPVYDTISPTGRLKEVFKYGARQALPTAPWAVGLEALLYSPEAGRGSELNAYR